MYVTRPLSLYKKSPQAISLPPSDGPNSGILVIQDEQELKPNSSIGFQEYHELKQLPFPQNLNIELFYRSGISLNRTTHYHHVAFIPVLDQPLSSNRYYVIQQTDKHRGEAYVSSKRDDLDTFCFYTSVYDVPLRPLDMSNAHQQFEIFPTRSRVTFRRGFSAKSVAPDGFPPKFLSRRWKLSAKTSNDSKLGAAEGLDDALRARHPEFNFPVGNKFSEAVVVGKWYCPFMFIKEGTSRSLKEEIRRPMFYEMTLEQKWEMIFSAKNDHGSGKNTVSVDAIVRKEEILVAGWKDVHEERDVSEGLLGFRSRNNVGEEHSVGLSKAIVERMIWEQERTGWVKGEDMEIKIQRVEEFEGIGRWRRFGCYVLVESFVLKRLDGSVVLSFAFKHTHQIRTKWE